MSSAIEIKGALRASEVEMIGFALAGRPACLAGQLGLALDYPDRGLALARRISGAWSGGFAPGETHRVLRGDELRALRRRLTEHGADPLGARARSAMVLFAPGVHLVLSRSPSPVAIALRRTLADRLMPDLPASGAHPLLHPVARSHEVEVMIQRLQQVVAFREVLAGEDFDYVVRRVLSSLAAGNAPAAEASAPSLYAEKYS